eukprot:s1236_g5.t1
MNLGAIDRKIKQDPGVHEAKKKEDASTVALSKYLCGVLRHNAAFWTWSDLFFVCEEMPCPAPPGRSRYRRGNILEHTVTSSLVFGYYQVRQDAWLLGLASYEDLGLTTPVIGTGACVNSKRPTVKKLQWLFRQSAKYAGFTALLRRLRATWAVHDTEFWLCEAAALRRFSFYDIEGGEFGCPMCRSVANCLVPCVPDKELFESPSSWDEACVAKMRPAPWLISHVEKCGTLASPSMQGRALALLRGACAELVTSSRLNPQALADEGPPPPLFAALLQDAAVLRYESDEPLPQSSQENWQAKIFQRLAKPRAPWLADPREEPFLLAS